MLNVRLEGCGWSKEVGLAASLRLEAHLLTGPEHGEIARYEAGYWRANDGHFISVLATPNCFVRFDDGKESTRPFGPYNLVRSSGGSIWTADPHERLLAKWYEAGPGWHCVHDRDRLWPAVTIAPLPFDL